MSVIQDAVILITGASSGIGEACARLLAQKGARVVLGARRSDRLQALAGEIREAGGSAEYQRLDVTSREDSQKFIDFALERFGRIDVLVNNAGVMPLSPLEALKVEEWDRMIDVNIRGVLHSIAAALPVMQAQRSGLRDQVCGAGDFRRVAPRGRRRYPRHPGIARGGRVGVGREHFRCAHP